MASSIWWMRNRVSCILRSITEGNTLRLSKLLGRRPTTAASQEDLSAPLVQAIRMGQEKCVLSLLTAGADPNGMDNEGKTPLYVVMEMAGGNPEILRALLKAKANPDQATWNLQHTPLHLAAKKGYQVGVKQLLAAGARPDKKDVAGNTSLMLAAKEGHVNIVRALLREGANAKGRNLANEAILHFAVKGGSVDCLAELLQAGANPNDRDSRGQTALFIACKLKNTKAVEILLDYECDVNGQDTNSGKTALHWAIQNGELNIVTELLDSGADPNIKDKNWTTPFLLALSTAGSRSIIELLLHAGCDVTVTDRSFNTALHLAATEGQVDLLPALVDAGIMVDIKGACGVTSLMLASYGGHLATVKQLLQYGANPNLVDRNRASALTYAILSKANDDVAFEIIKMLIRSNCELDNSANLKKLVQQLDRDFEKSVDVEEFRLYSPIEVAYLLSKTAVFMMIIKAGANANSFTERPSGLLTPFGKHQENDQRNQWYLVHCLRKEQQQIKSLVELCRRPALRFLSKQYKGHNFTMPQKISHLPFTDRVKSFLNYNDLDEVQVKYNVTLRDKQPAQKKASLNGSTTWIGVRDSTLAFEKQRGTGTQTGVSSSWMNFKQSSTGMSRNVSVRQSLPIGFNSQKSGVPLASSTPKATPEKSRGGQRSISTCGESSSSLSENKPRRTSFTVFRTSRLSTPKQEYHHDAHRNSLRPASSPFTSILQRPPITSTHSPTRSAGLHSKTASSNNLELTRNMVNHIQLKEPIMSLYGPLKKTGKSGHVSEYEKLENAYDELRSNMIIKGSISDISSSSNSLYDTRPIKRRGRYNQLNPTQMLLSPPPTIETDNDSIFFNSKLSPQSVISDNSSVHSGGYKSLVSPSSPNESKSSVEEAESRERSILKYRNMYNKKCMSSTPVVKSGSQEVANGPGKMDWGLKCLRSPNISNMGPEPSAAPVIMDEQEKKLLEDLMKEVENNNNNSHLGINPDERPLTPMNEQTKKAIYDKRWARAPKPADNGNATHSPRIPTVCGDTTRNLHSPRAYGDTPGSLRSAPAYGDTPHSPHSPVVYRDTPHSPLSATVFGDTAHSPHSPLVCGDKPHNPHSATVYGDTPRSPHSPIVYDATPHSPCSATVIGDTPYSPHSATAYGDTPRSPLSATVYGDKYSLFSATVYGETLHSPQPPTVYAGTPQTESTPVVHGDASHSPFFSTVYGETPHVPCSPTAYKDAQHSPHSPTIFDFDNTPAALQKRMSYTQQAAERSLMELRSSLQNLTMPLGSEKKIVRFTPPAEKLQMNLKQSEKNENLIESELPDVDDLNLKRWGTMTLDNPEVLHNSENFTSDKSLRSPTGKTQTTPKASSNSTIKNCTNNRSLPSDRLAMSSRSAVASQLASYGESPPKVGLKSWSLSPQGYRSLNKGQDTRKVANRTSLDDNCSNQNECHMKNPPARIAARTHQAPAPNRFQRSSAQYSSVRVRGTQGQRHSAPIATHDKPPLQNTTSMRTVGVKSTDCSDVIVESALTSSAEKKKLWSGTKREGVEHNKDKNTSAGSKIKMAFLRSKSFRR